MSYPFIAARWYSTNAIVEVRALVLHFSEGGGTVGYLTDPKRSDGTRIDVSAHFVVERTGRIVQMVRDQDADHCQHISYGSWKYPGNLTRANGEAVLGPDVMGQADPTRVNRYVQAIEIEGFRASGPNAAQAGSLRTLVAERRAKYPAMRGLLGHGDVQDKPCPGALIPWADLGGHGLFAETGDTMGLQLTYPPGAIVSGTLTIPKDANSFRVRDGSRYKATQDAKRPAVVINLVDHPAAGQGYLVDLNGDESHFVLSTSVPPGSFVATPAAPSPDCSDAVAAEHERTRNAAIAAVEAI